MKWIKSKIVPPDVPSAFTEYQGASAKPIGGGELKAQSYQAGGLWHFQIIFLSGDSLKAPRFPRLEEVFSAMKILLAEGIAMGVIFDSAGVDEMIEGEPAGLTLTEYGRFDRKPVM